MTAQAVTDAINSSLKETPPHTMSSEELEKRMSSQRWMSEYEKEFQGIPIVATSTMFKDDDGAGDSTYIPSMDPALRLSSLRSLAAASRSTSLAAAPGSDDNIRLPSLKSLASLAGDTAHLPDLPVSRTESRFSTMDSARFASLDLRLASLDAARMGSSDWLQQNLVPDRMPTRDFIAKKLLSEEEPTLSQEHSNVPKNQPVVPPARAEREYIDKIGEWDVLCGRGGKSNRHKGNKRYRKLVSEMKSMYRDTGAKTAKTDLSRSIVKFVANYGGRFVKKDAKKGLLYVMTDDEARKKTSQALRETKILKWTDVDED